MTEICLDREIENLYCPVTGEPVLHPEGYNTPAALLFIYIKEINDFEYCSGKLKQKFPLHFNEAGETVNGAFLFQTMKRHFDWGQDKLLITYGTLGAVTLGFDLGYDNN